MNQMMGPRLSDAKFFGELIDCTLSGLEDIPDAVAEENYAMCRKIFAEHVREILREKETLFFSMPYEFPPNDFIMPGEDVEDAVERIKKNRFVSVGIPHQYENEVDWFANPTPNHYKEWTWQLNRHHEWKLLANHYRETGDESSAEAAVQLFDGWVKQATVPGDDVKGNETLCWRTIECGTRMGVDWPYTLFCIYKSKYFTDDILVDWYKSVWEHGHRLQLNHRTGNWLIIEMNGLGHIGILYPQLKASKEWLDYAVNKLTEELDLQVYPDGFQSELTTGYQYVVINNYMRFVKIAEVFGIKIPDAYLKYMEDMLEVSIRLMMPDGCIPDLNDGSHGQIKPLIERHLVHFPMNKSLRWVCHDRNGEGKPAYQSVAFEYAGIMVMRDGWEKDSTWALMDAAPFGTGHQHEDKLNLLVHAKGRNIITECGCYPYDDSEMRKYALSTRSHNTIRVNGKDQNRRGGYEWRQEDIRKKADMRYCINSEYDYVSSRYCEGYGMDKDKSVSHERSVIFVKRPGNDMVPYFIVIDRMFATESNHYEILWHVDAEEILVKGMKTKADFMHIITSLNDVKTDGIDIISGQQYPEWQGWKRGSEYIPGNDVRQPVIRYHIVGSSERIVTVLYPDDDCPIESVEAGTDVDDTLINIVLKNGERIQLDEKIIKE